MNKRKGSNSGMPIIAVVGVIATLVGMGVIFQVSTGLAEDTGKDHDKRELVDLGSAINNKCTDLSGTSDTTSITPISVDFEINSDATFSKQGNMLEIAYSGEGEDNVELPHDSCNITMDFDELGPGNHQLEVSGEQTSNKPEITVSETGS